MDNRDGMGIVYREPHSKRLLIHKEPRFPYILPEIPEKYSFVVAHMRNKNYGEVNIDNTQPFMFRDDHTYHVFAHNGKINGFSEKDKTVLMEHIHDHYKPSIRGETDSELLFYMLLSCSVNGLLSISDVNRTLYIWLDKIKTLFGKRKIYVNFVYVNKMYSIFGRMKYNTNKSLSLYYDYQRGVVSSEPVTFEYSYVPENTCWCFHNGRKQMRQII